MAKITKRVDKGVSRASRTQVFTEADAGVGDILMVSDSLGRPAGSTTIKATAAISVRLNALQKVYQRQDRPDMSYSGALPELSTEQEYLDTTQAPIALLAGESMVIDSTPVDTIELVSVGGAFIIMVD